MSIPIQEMAVASDECKTAKSGCNGIQIQVLTDKCRMMDSQLGAMDSKQREAAQSKIDSFWRIAEGISRGEKPLDMIDPGDMTALNNAIRIRVIQMKGSAEEITESFYEKDFKKSGSAAAIASKIYSEDELRKLVEKCKTSTGVDALSIELIEKLRRSLRGGHDVNKNKLSESRQNLRNELRTQKRGGSVLWNYNELLSSLRVLNDKAVTARGENSARVPYDDAISVATDVISNVLGDSNESAGDEKKGTAIAELLIYPEILENIDTSQSELDDDSFDAVVESFNHMLGINSAADILAATVPYLGIKIPASAKHRGGATPAPAPEPVYQPDPRPSQRDRYEQQSRSYGGRYGSDVAEIEQMIMQYKPKIKEYMEYGEEVLDNILEYDEKGIPNNERFIKNYGIVCMAGGEALGNALDLMTKLYEKISYIPQEDYSKEIYDYIQYVSSLVPAEDIDAHRLYLSCHSRGAGRLIKFRKAEWIIFLIWFVMFVVTTIALIFG